MIQAAVQRMTAEDKNNGDRIEILSVDLLRAYASRVEEFKKISSMLSIGLGWHYLLDLTWITTQGLVQPGIRVLDAGAGFGLLQWWLASRGVDVISVDKADRSVPPQIVRDHFSIKGLRDSDLAPDKISSLRDFLPPRSPLRWHTYPQKLKAALDNRRRVPEKPATEGTVFLYNQDLTQMDDIPGNSVDAAVSVSALEHNSIEPLRLCIREILRTLKPGGKLIATVGAAKDTDWFHEPSKGWCYTEKTLRQLFDLRDECPSNYNRHDELFEMLRGCKELKENLAPMYFQSGNNGMPWGVWDPQYQPVGIIKCKPR